MKKSPLDRCAFSLADLFVQHLPGSDAAELINIASELFCSGKKPPWLRAVSRSVAFQFAEDRCRPLVADVAEVIRNHLSFKLAYSKGKLPRPNNLLICAKMLPAIGRPEQWQVPAATNTAALAKLTELHIDDLNWLLSTNPKHRHYHIKWHRKKNGSFRIIEIPKLLLKETQQIILSKILSQIPIHESACGFCPGKSVIDFTQPHCGKEIVLKMDFKNYFPSIRSGRVRRLFMTAGYPENIAGSLSDLCTNSLDDIDFAESNLRLEQKRIYSQRHLPQGAPTSPAIANLITYRLDCRLAGLARSAGANYTRYADDLLFSGDHQFLRQADRFHLKVLSIILEEGFQINPRKTRFMKASQRQQAAGLVLNEKPNIDRREYDRLKAILTNCVRKGILTENRQQNPEFEAMLLGKILWVNQSNPLRGAKLLKLYQQIDFGSSI